MIGGRRRHSKITRELPPEIVEAVNQKLVDGFTYEEIANWLRSLGHEVSRSTVGRYGKEFLSKLERLKLAKEQAKAIVSEMGDAPATELHEAANQLAVQLIMETLIRVPDLEGEKVSELLKALAHLERSSVSREKLKAEFRQKAEATVSGLRDEELAGKSPEEIREIIRRRIREEYGA